MNRLREPSTYAGIGAIALAFGLSTDVAMAIPEILALIMGIVSILLPEVGDR